MTDHPEIDLDEAMGRNHYNRPSAIDTALDHIRSLEAENNRLTEQLKKYESGELRSVDGVVVPVGTPMPQRPVFPAKWYYLEQTGPFLDDGDPAELPYYGPYDKYTEAFAAWSQDVGYDGPMFALPGLPTEDGAK